MMTQSRRKAVGGTPVRTRRWSFARWGGFFVAQRFRSASGTYSNPPGDWLIFAESSEQKCACPPSEPSGKPKSAACWASRRAGCGARRATYPSSPPTTLRRWSARWRARRGGVAHHLALPRHKAVGGGGKEWVKGRKESGDRAWRRLARHL